MNSAGEDIKKGTYLFCAAEKQYISQFTADLKKELQRQLEQSTHLLNNTEKNLNNLSPQNVLKRGYSITQLNGKSVRTSEQVKAGDSLTTLLYKGSVSSTVKTKDNE